MVYTAYTHIFTRARYKACRRERLMRVFPRSVDTNILLWGVIRAGQTQPDTLSAQYFTSVSDSALAYFAPHL